MDAPSVTAKHFPQKGERFINGEWVQPEPAAPRPSLRPERKVETAADRRNYANRLAGWPAPKEKST